MEAGEPCKFSLNADIAKAHVQVGPGRSGMSDVFCFLNCLVEQGGNFWRSLSCLLVESSHGLDWQTWNEDFGQVTGSLSFVLWTTSTWRWEGPPDGSPFGVFS